MLFQQTNQIKKVEKFGVRRSLLAYVLSESWKRSPHAGGNYEPDVTEFWNAYQALRKKDPKWADITANSLLLYVITQGIIACPILNSHVSHSPKLATGKVKQFSNIDINMPMVLPTGGMMAAHLHNCESKNLRQLADAVQDFRRRLDNTILDRPMFSAAMDDTMQHTVRGRLDIVLPRLIGTAATGKIPILLGKARKAYHAIPKRDRLSKRDIDAGTITVSNWGSVYKGAYAPPSIAVFTPPQVCFIAIGGMTERPGVVTKPDGSKTIEPRKFISFLIMFDHRALDYADTVPFMRRL
ncbi:MAG: 2-oxo acid dehydrogenase subunit E2, partial [Burkholderiaceae bacterium]|nr:2-oxo acid dehydrogenase subunit E2 [Burkholderiaceae bacterium]